MADQIDRANDIEGQVTDREIASIQPSSEMNRAARRPAESGRMASRTGAPRDIGGLTRDAPAGT